MNPKSKIEFLSVLAIREILRRQPNLGADGFWPNRSIRAAFGITRKTFREDRLKMTSAEGVREFTFAMDFLRGRPSRKSFSGLSSYSLKHSAERWCQWQTGEHAYVSNSMFIVAAIVSGFKIKLIPGSQNCLINIALRGLPAVWQIDGNSVRPERPFMKVITGVKSFDDPGR
jgi:hypothetical protein